MSTILWRRLDTAGHDACRLTEEDGVFRLQGTALFRHEDQPACLSYRISCNSQWQTLAGSVRGWVGERELRIDVARESEGTWVLNDRRIGHLAGCVDLDLGFTPATNLFQLKRIALAVGQAADVPVAWLDVDTDSLELLHQRYERRSEHGYWYEASRFGYTALLKVNAAGFVTSYPGLWEAESMAGSSRHREEP